MYDDIRLSFFLGLVDSVALSFSSSAWRCLTISNNQSLFFFFFFLPFLSFLAQKGFIRGHPCTQGIDIPMYLALPTTNYASIKR